MKYNMGDAKTIKEIIAEVDTDRVSLHTLDVSSSYWNIKGKIQFQLFSDMLENLYCLGRKFEINYSCSPISGCYYFPIKLVRFSRFSFVDHILVGNIVPFTVINFMFRNLLKVETRRNILYFCVFNMKD